MGETARAIVADMACLKKGHNVLVICGLHNRVFAEQVQLECYRIGAYPYLWVFDEKFFLKHAKRFAQDTVAVLPKHVDSLLESSDVVIWLSQFEDLEKFPNSVRRAMFSFWDSVYAKIENKPRLTVNLISPKWTKTMDIPYAKFFQSFANAVRVDYSKLRRIGKAVAARLDGKKQIHVYDTNGTDLTFSIEGRLVGVEVGTLEDCFSSGEECEVEVPSGEVYVAPLETSADGILVVDEFSDYRIRGLELVFDEGRVSSFKAERGGSVFEELLEKATGDKDRIAEFGVGTNYGMKPFGYRLFDEKALGTVHIAIGNNVHLGGVNEASIHYDFVLRNPTVEVDNAVLMEKGRLINI